MYVCGGGICIHEPTHTTVYRLNNGGGYVHMHLLAQLCIGLTMVATLRTTKTVGW